MSKADILAKLVSNGSVLEDGNISLSEIGAQEALISGTTIKTINGSNILGSGDLVISGGPCARS